MNRSINILRAREGRYIGLSEGIKHRADANYALALRIRFFGAGANVIWGVTRIPMRL